MDDQLTDEELQQLMAVQPRAFDATQLQPVIAPPNTQPNPSMPPIQAPDVQAQGQQPQATPQVAIAPPPAVQAQHRQFTPVSMPTQPETSPSVSISAPKPATVAPVTLPKPIATPLAVAQPLAPGVPAPVTLPDKDDDPLQAKTERDQAEQARLERSGSGISQIFKPVDAEGNPDPNKHPGFWKKVGGVAARVGDIGLTTLFPSVAAQIPGTELHHQVLMNQQNQRVGIDLGHLKAQQDIDKPEDAPTITTDQGIMQLNPDTGRYDIKVGNAPGKEEWAHIPDFTGPNGEPLEIEKHSGQMRIAQGVDGSKLKPAQPKEGEVPLGDRVDQLNRMLASRYQVLHPRKSLPDQYTLPASANQKDYERIDKGLEAEERAVSTKQQQDTVNEMRRQTAALAAQNRGPKQLAVIDGKVVELRPGMTVPAGTQSLNGELKGSKPTADEQRRADLAGNLNENLDRLEDILARRPELFGPAAGRLTAFKSAVGSSDPDIAALETIKHQMGMAQISAHGMRSAQGVESAAHSLVNNFNNTPAAMKGAIEAARGSIGTFINDANNPGANRAAQPGANQSSQPSRTGGNKQSGVQPANSSGKGVSLTAARQLPQYKGKSDKEIRAAIQSYGHQVLP